jgi:sporulation protein YlmC with PRC-barrel domain
MNMSDTRGLGASDVSTDETDRLISSEKVEGTAVYNRQGDRLGTINHVMIDKYTGQVSYAVMSFGGFLGIGEEYHPLPWKVLTYDTRLGGYVVDIDRSRLEKAPRYRSSEAPNWSDRAYTGRIDQYWIMPPV